MNILLYADDGFDVDVTQLAEALNERTAHLSFRVGNAEYRSGDEPISRPASYEALPSDLLQEAEGTLRTFLFTNTRYANNYFFQSSDHLAIVSFSGWEYLTRLPLSNGAVYMIVDALALILDKNHRHQESTGCIYDFLGDKTGVDIGMRSAYMCPDCLSRLATKEFSKRQQGIFKDVRILLDALSQASKWNEDILELLTNKQEAPTGAEQNDSFEIAPLDFIPGSNDNGHIDVRRDQIRELCNCYVDLRQGNHEPQKKGQLFETFAVAFFGLIKGWSILEQNANMDDCEIDIIYDISQGPMPLREKFGAHLYVECKNRTKRANVRDVSHFAMNLLSRDLKAGIFFAMNGITGYESDNWRTTTAAYKRIIDTCRKFNVMILPMVGEDIEFVRNGGNLVECLLDRANRFVRL